MFDEMIEDQKKVETLINQYEEINGELSKSKRDLAKVQLENYIFALGVLPKVEDLKLS